MHLGPHYFCKSWNTPPGESPFHPQESCSQLHLCPTLPLVSTSQLLGDFTSCQRPFNRWSLHFPFPCLGFIHLELSTPGPHRTQMECPRSPCNMYPSCHLPFLSYILPCCCSVIHLYPTVCDPTDCSTPGFPVLHCLPELAQTHVHWMMPSNHLV